jgi:hypothetical protein
MAEQDVLQRTTRQLRDRLKELEPLVQERDRVKAALDALESSGAKERGDGQLEGRGVEGPRDAQDEGREAGSAAQGAERRAGPTPLRSGEESGDPALAAPHAVQAA